MKRLLLILASVALLIACGSKGTGSTSGTAGKGSSAIFNMEAEPTSLDPHAQQDCKVSFLTKTAEG